MKREIPAPRPDIEAHFKEFGFRFAAQDGEIYWDESTRYVFTLDEVEKRLERATQELRFLSLQLVDRVAKDEKRLAQLGAPRHAFAAIAESWTRRDPSLYGRFAFAYHGAGAPKLLECNADTPTSPDESAVAQWFWLEQMRAGGQLPKDADQFNSLHERLIARWRETSLGRFLHLACMSASVEDIGAIAYREDCARAAGMQTLAIDMADVGVDGSIFVDRRGRRIDFLFKLYPWEWMFADDFGHDPALLDTRCVEPPRKMILSSKGALAMLREMAPGHPNLLPCFFEDDRRAAELGDRYARKPLFSREGADAELVDGSARVKGVSDGYGAEGFVRQALCPPPDFDDRRPVLGCWVVGDAPAGMGVRENVSPITSNRSRFLSHATIG